MSEQQQVQQKQQVKKVVLAYSGGLDTSVIVPWLVENYGCEVICFCANLGQEEELSGLEAKAIASGASKIYIEDLREEFVTDFIYPTLTAGATYEREYLSVRAMQPGGEHVEDRFRQHWQGSREGSAGGVGAAGGGCGCN